MMTKTDTSAPIQDDLFKVMLRDLVAKGHELVLLRDAIDWSRFERLLPQPTAATTDAPLFPSG